MQCTVQSSWNRTVRLEDTSFGCMIPPLNCEQISLGNEKYIFIPSGGMCAIDRPVLHVLVNTLWCASRYETSWASRATLGYGRPRSRNHGCSFDPRKVVGKAWQANWTLDSSFSVASMPTFAMQASLESSESRRDLNDYLSTYSIILYLSFCKIQRNLIDFRGTKLIFGGLIVAMKRIFP